jgi:hypothetical protein
MKRLFLRSLSLFFRPLFLVLALFLVFEEWLWDRLKAQLARLAALPIVAQAEVRLRSLGPWPSLFVLVAPAVILFPFKLLALWALANDHATLGVVIIVAAKITGTAVAAHLFELVKESARKLVWFDRLYVWVTGTLAAVKRWLNERPAVILVRQWIARTKSFIRNFLKSGSRKSHRAKRNMRAAKKRAQLMVFSGK